MDGRRIDVEEEDDEEREFVELEGPSSGVIDSGPLNYIAGYICRKVGFEGSSTSDPNSWIALRGEGRLIQPSTMMKDLVDKCDKVFNEFHGSGLEICRNPIHRVVNKILSKYVTMPPRVALLFCKVKFFMHMKKFNVVLKQKRLNKSVRPFKQNAYFMN